jgi:hypothetical protein
MLVTRNLVEFPARQMNSQMTCSTFALKAFVPPPIIQAWITLALLSRLWYERLEPGLRDPDSNLD